MAAINPTPEYVAHLLSMAHSPNELSSKGFVLKPLSPAELLKKARCDKCNKRPSKPKPWKPKARPKNSIPKDSLTAGIPSANSLGKLDGQYPNVHSGGCFSRRTPTSSGQMLTLREAPPTGESSPSVIMGRVGILTHVSMSDACEANNDNDSSAAHIRTIASPYSAAAELPRGQKIQGKCFNCGRVGHKAADCPEERRALPNMQQKPPKPPCQWHPGARSGTIYLCCRAHVSTPGCQSAPTHSLPTTLSPALTTRFQVQTTPLSATLTLPKALAVAIDCEMGTAFDGEPELIRVTVLDYFTSATLLDSLVWPDIPMQHFNTRYSGVTAPQMWAAKRDRTCLFGVEAARLEVWRHVDAGTVVVGHDVKNDLAALRWAHGVVVDSMLVEAAARKRDAERMDDKEKENRDAAAAAASSSGGSVAGADCATSQKGNVEHKEPGLNLKDVSKLRLGRTIQRRTHDSFEDALASRDIVHYYTTMRMRE